MASLAEREAVASTGGCGRLKTVKEVWWWERSPERAGDLSHRSLQLRWSLVLLKEAANNSKIFLIAG
jgi:hypothetical protein